MIELQLEWSETVSAWICSFISEGISANSFTLIPTNSHNGKFITIGSTKGCHSENLLWYQWQESCIMTTFDLSVTGMTISLYYIRPKKIWWSFRQRQVHHVRLILELWGVRGVFVENTGGQVTSMKRWNRIWGLPCVESLSTLEKAWVMMAQRSADLLTGSDGVICERIRRTVACLAAT